MVEENTMRAAMQEYVDAFNRADLEGLVGLYADDATVDDPVGTPTIEGKTAIEAFYRGSLETGARLRLAAPIRASHAQSAAMAFDVELELDHKPTRIRVIDVMTFNKDGRFASMHAYWGPGDMEALAQESAP